VNHPGGPIRDKGDNYGRAVAPSPAGHALARRAMAARRKSLNNGQVLISGGKNGTYPAKVTVTATATLFDPATGTCAPTGDMTIPREFHTLTVLPNGQVLAAGGETQNNKGQFSATASAELYTP